MAHVQITIVNQPNGDKNILVTFPKERNPIISYEKLHGQDIPLCNVSYMSPSTPQEGSNAAPSPTFEECTVKIFLSPEEQTCLQQEQ